MSAPAERTYTMRRSAGETRRLVTQGGLYRDHTRRLFEQAGGGPGSKSWTWAAGRLTSPSRWPEALARASHQRGGRRRCCTWSPRATPTGRSPPRGA